MKLSDVLSAAMALTADERLRLVDAIALVDNLRVDVVDDPKTMAAAMAEARPITEQLEPANNRKAYSGDDLALLKEIASIKPGSMEERPQMRRAAKKLGRTYKAIAEKIRTIRAE